MKKDYESLKSCILCKSSNIDVYNQDMNLGICGECGHIFDNPRPTQNRIVSFYSKQDKYNGWFKNEDVLDAYWIIFKKRLQKYKKTGRLLDIGSGIGQMLSLLKKDFEIHGTELSTEAIVQAKKRYGIVLQNGEVEFIKFKHKFEIITLCQILEHFPFPGRTLEHCKSILEKNGILYITIPNEGKFSLRMILPGLFSILGFKKYKEFSSTGFRKISIETMEEIHLSHFDTKVIVSYLENIGFVIEEISQEFIDPFIGRKGIVGIIRVLSYYFCLLFKKITGIPMYNSIGIIARKI